MKPGQYLWFRLCEDWNLYYKIIRINNASISISAPGDTETPDSKSDVIHRVLETSNFSSGTPILTIEGFGKYLARIQRSKRKIMRRKTMSSNDFYMLYQLKGGDETREHRFESYASLKNKGLAVDKENYNHIYTAFLDDGMTLDDIFERFNLSRPADFAGHSLSVSDVVVLVRGESHRAFYVNDFGFADVPEFMAEPFKYYSAMRPVDIGTIPKTESNPLAVVSYADRTWVESETFQVWGHITYGMPLTQKQMEDYELRAASDNPDLACISPYQFVAQVQFVGKWEQSKSVPGIKQLTRWDDDWDVYVKKDFVTNERITERFRQAIDVYFGIA